jgi:uncharacterized protein DUF6894
MPRYYFHLCNDQTVSDPDGTNLSGRREAPPHAATVAEELTFRSSGMMGRDWSRWTMSVRDDKGNEVFSFRLMAAEPEH